MEIFDFLKENNIPFFVIITKTDKINQKGKSQLLKRLKELEIEDNVYLTSSLEQRTLDKLRSGIEAKI